MLRMIRMSFTTCLARPVHATEKTTEMPRQPHEQHGDCFDQETVIRQGLLGMATRSEVNPKHQTDEHARYTAQN
jgi:hypothetical protein